MPLRGRTLVELQNASRWIDSNMPAHYTRQRAAGKGTVARWRGSGLGEYVDGHSSISCTGDHLDSRVSRSSPRAVQANRGISVEFEYCYDFS